MAKRVKEVAMDSRTARMKLTPRHKPYFRLLADGVHIGYRRSTVAKRAGTWMARRFLGAGTYETALLATADDTPGKPSDGVKTMTFDEAQIAARAWAGGKAAAIRAAAAQTVAVTVRSAVQAYIAMRLTRSARAGRDAELRLGHHVLAAPLADVVLSELTEKHLADWQGTLQRGGRGVKGDAPALAPATLARLLNDLRAALTAAARKGRLPGALATISEGLRAPKGHNRAREKQVLPDGDVRRLVEAAYGVDEDFGALVMVLASTGSRLDQAARLTVADLQPGNRRVMIPVSAKGRADKQQEKIATPLPDDVLARLRPLVAGRRGHERLLLRWHHEQNAGDREAGKLPAWVRAGRRPWTVSAEMSRPWHAALLAAELPGDLTPYCLRHSSIVRGLRAGLPVRLVAEVHDTSVGMVEKHYGAFVTHAMEDLLRRAVVPMAPPAPADVASLDAARAKGIRETLAG